MMTPQEAPKDQLNSVQAGRAAELCLDEVDDQQEEA
jgi:hypothetical protein